MGPDGSMWAHIKTGRSYIAQNHFWTPPDPAQKAYKPLPDGVAINIPGIATAWMIFQRVDVDDSGRLDQDEVCRVVKLLGLAWSKKRLRHAFDEMATADPTAAKGAQRIMGVSFHDFAQWWARNRAAARRDAGWRSWLEGSARRGGSACRLSPKEWIEKMK